MNWLLRLLGLGPKELPPAPIQEEPLVVTPPVTSEEEFKFAVGNVLNEVFLEAVNEVHAARYEKEKELLNDQKLRAYIKKFLKYGVSEAPSHQHSFLVSSSDLGMEKSILYTFYKIVHELCNNFKIKTEWTGQYISVDSPSFMAAMETLYTPVINIDERMRAMLSQGIYR
jgi:DNA-directed RNA polymerase subunit L